MKNAKIKIALRKSDGKRTKSNDITGDCLVARAVIRTLRDNGVSFDRVVCGVTSITVNYGKKEIAANIPEDIQSLILDWLNKSDNGKDYSPSKKSFELEFKSRD